MSWFDDTKNWLYLQKEGIIIGGLLGLLCAMIYFKIGGDYLFAATPMGFVGEALFSAGASLKEVAFTKIGLIFILVGMVLGAIIDMVIAPRK